MAPPEGSELRPKAGHSGHSGPYHRSQWASAEPVGQRYGAGPLTLTGGEKPRIRSAVLLIFDRSAGASLMPFENLLTLETGLEVVKGLKELALRDHPDHRLNDRICKALRTIYFTPNGILSLLEELDQSGGVPSDDLRESAHQLQ
jgi:hypothetical protein